jgi:murein DD-endopeptidase MepM/ murein hydrolase activator NlpD
MGFAIGRRTMRAIRVFGAAVSALLLAHCASPAPQRTAWRPAPGTSFVVPVRAGDTLSEIAQRYRVKREDVMAMNGISNPDQILRGDRLYVPAYGQPNAWRMASADARLASSSPAPKPRAASYRSDVPVPKQAPRDIAVRQRPVTRPAPASLPVPAGNARFVWPVNGPVVSGFGAAANGQRNDGINIAAPAGTPVHAAESGIVTYVGNELRGYGNLLLIRHDDGFVTAYAHNDRIVVQRGDRVQRGQVVSYTGTTGDVTQPQLHFEIRQGTKPVNPAAYLGRGTSQASLTPSSPARS